MNIECVVGRRCLLLAFAWLAALVGLSARAMGADVVLPIIPQLDAGSTYQSVQLDMSGVPTSSACFGVKVELGWQNLISATSAGARFMLSTAPPGATTPPASPQFAYVAPTTWTSGSSNTTLTASLLSVVVLNINYTRNVSATPLYFCYRQTAGSARWTSVKVTLLNLTTPPVNDTPAGAIDVTGLTMPFVTPITDIRNAAAMIADEPAGACTGTARRQIWYRMTPTQTFWCRASTCVNELGAVGLNDTILAAYEMQGSTLVPLGCDNNLSCDGNDNTRSRITFKADAGTTYYLSIASNESAPVSYSQPTNILAARVWSVPQPPMPPTNISCATVVQVPPAGPFPWVDLRTTQGIPSLSNDIPPGICVSALRHVLWYTFTPTVAGAYRFSTCADAAPLGSVEDTVIVVAQGECGSLVSLACSDNAVAPDEASPCSGAASQRSNVVLNLEPGQQYRILVGRVGSPLSAWETTASLMVDFRGLGGCQSADIADDAGAPLPSTQPNTGVNEGDYNAFFQGFFDALGHCDIADDAGAAPPMGVNSGVNEGDYNAFFQSYFQGCP